eukprot:NODE_136_length_18060_cov_0.656645.p1 type:complete len:465 gc:universal NODE_136_length_18060_cov_0.656645:15805-17199(+)
MNLTFSGFIKGGILLKYTIPLSSFACPNTSKAFSIPNLLRNLPILKSPMSNKIITIIGTTAVGKSNLAIELANLLNGEVINADSLQVYKDAPILTNKVLIREPKHHLMNFIEWDKTYSVRDFIRDADKIISDILNRGKVPILVGGTNYYIELLLWGNDFHEYGFDDDSKLYNDLDTNTLIEKVKLFDMDYALKNSNNRRRLVYAMNMNASGHSLKNNFSDRWKTKCRYNSLFIWCSSDMAVLDHRINARVDSMVSNGLLDELDLLDRFWKIRNPVYYNDVKENQVEGIFQSIGFKEFGSYLNSKKEENLIEALELMKLRTRQYARRQIQWIRARIVPRLFNSFQTSDCHLCLVDCSFVEMWKDTVIPSALYCVEKYFAGVKVDRKVALQRQFDMYKALGNIDSSHLADILDTHISNIYPDPIAFEDPNKRFECKTCNKYIFGSRQWKAHLSSKKHIKAKSTLKP